MMVALEDNHAKDFAHIYAAGALSPEVHRSLVMNLGRLSKRAGVADSYIFSPLPEQMFPHKELLKNLPAYMHKYAGVLFRSQHLTDAPNTLTGVLVRNFIDARLMLLEDALDLAKEPVDETCTVLVIPNFFVCEMQLPEWDLAKVFRLLLRRKSAGKFTVLFGPDKGVFAPRMGEAVAALVQKNYFLV